MAIEFIHGGDETIREFLIGRDADVTQNRACKLGEKALDKIQPGAMLQREGEFKAPGG
jgi:hypothetical protein